MRKRVLASVLLVVLSIAAASLMSCAPDNASIRKENEEKVIRAATEYPGDGLYDPIIVTIGNGADEFTESELAEVAERAATEKEAWRDTVEACFADGMFDTFYGKWYRTHILSIAHAAGLTTEISGFVIEDGDNKDSIEHVIVTVNTVNQSGEAETYEMDWRVQFDKDDTRFIQKIELINDGGLYDSFVSGV